MQNYKIFSEKELQNRRLSSGSRARQRVRLDTKYMTHKIINV